MTSTPLTCSTALVCPICVDDMTLSFPNAQNTALGRSCCGNMVCQSCLYRHIHSVLTEGLTGQGRKDVVCPLGCGGAVTDGEIRTCFHRQHYDWLGDWLGQIVFAMLLCCYGEKWSKDPFRSSRYYESWYYWSHSGRERQDLVRYEQWNLALGMASIQQQEVIIHCPAPNCDHLWLAANPDYRRTKQQHERSKVYLWYSPLSKKEPPLPFDWVRAEYLNMHLYNNGNNQALDEDREMVEINRDPRYLACGKCRASFCSLCRRPWSAGHNLSHQGLSCASYLSKLQARGLIEDDEFVFSAQAMNARMCPGCSMRTFRTSGCNHMTCPCGMEWCYICECRWNPTHYSCVERRNRRRRRSALPGTANCIIS